MVRYSSHGLNSRLIVRYSDAQLILSGSLPAHEKSVNRMVLLTECPLFGSPLYSLCIKLSMNPLSIKKSWDIKILDLFWRKGVVLFVPNQHCKLFFESVLLRTGLNVCLKFPKNFNFLLLCCSVFEWLIQVVREICRNLSWNDLEIIFNSCEKYCIFYCWALGGPMIDLSLIQGNQGHQWRINTVQS